MPAARYSYGTCGRRRSPDSTPSGRPCPEGRNRTYQPLAGAKSSRTPNCSRQH